MLQRFIRGSKSDNNCVTIVVWYIWESKGCVVIIIFCFYMDFQCRSEDELRSVSNTRPACIWNWFGNNYFFSWEVKKNKTISVINKSRVIKMTLLSSALHWNYIKTLKQTKKLPLRPDFITCRNVSLRWNSASQAAESGPLTTGRRDSASSGLWSRYAKKSKARDGRRSCPIFYSAFDSWKGPSGWTQREYQKGKIKKKEPTVRFHNADGRQIR